MENTIIISITKGRWKMKKCKTASLLIIVTLILSMVAPSVMPAFNNVTVADASTTVKLNATKLTLKVGDTYKLKVKGTTKTVTWSSGNKSIASVSSKGKVTAKAEGTATITGKVGTKKYTCKVTVKAVETTIYGKVTAVNGKKITLALGTLKEQGGSQPSGTPAQPSGTPAQPSGTPEAAQSTSAPSSDASKTAPGSASGNTNNNQGAANQTGGQAGETPDLLTLTGETVTITISDTSILSKESMQGPGDKTDGSSTSATTTTDNTASLSDIVEGSILKVTYKTSTDNLVSVVILGAGQAGTGQPGGTGGTGGSTSVSTGTGAYNLTDGEALTGGTYTSANADENAIRADNKITASLTDVTVSKTGGAASNSDASSFYGLNAAVLALGGATLNITGGSVTATTEGSNGVFAYDGATINIKDTIINVSGGNAGGIEVAGGGILNATNLTVTSKVKAAIRSDRGGGTLTVNGGTYTTSGSSGAPAVYSTADITVNDATLTANDSEAIVVEGLNSVTLNNCIITGAMSGTYGSASSENIHNVMLYQSMSGDAEVGNSSFTMTGGSLTSRNGDMFYVTNTDCVITLSKAALTLADGTKLLVVAGNDGSRGWGSAGANGGNCTFTVNNQTISGNITVDKISKLNLTIKTSSTYTGAINSDGTSASALSVTLDSTSTWTLTGDSYITEFNGSMSNVNTNGHTLYVNGVAMN